MDFEEKTLESQRIYEGKILSLKKDKVLLPNGETSYREIVEHNGGSTVIAEKDGKILLVSQFRYAYKEQIWEIPAGKIDKGETPDKTAIRELEEECGYRAGSVKLLFEVYPTPGYTSEKIYIYKASDLVKTQTHFDDDENLTSKWFTKEELADMISKGVIKDGKTLIALLFVLK
ncbi:MAG: NUDIX hydrolase [Clostridia bacterium]|nr:NUDIX hydrolase [Clostridia bacterium]